MALFFQDPYVLCDAPGLCLARVVLEDGEARLEKMACPSGGLESGKHAVPFFPRTADDQCSGIKPNPLGIAELRPKRVALGRQQQNASWSGQTV